MTTIHKRALVLAVLGAVPIVAAYLYTRPDQGLEQMVRTRTVVRRATSWRAHTRTRWWEEEESMNCAEASERGRQQCGNGPRTRWGQELFPARETLLYQHARFRKGEKRTVDDVACRDWLEVANIGAENDRVVRIDCIGEDDLPRQIVLRPGTSDVVTLDFSGWNATAISSYEFHQPVPRQSVTPTVLP